MFLCRPASSLVLLALIEVALLVVPAGAQPKPSKGFDAEMTQYFLSSTKKAEAHKYSKFNRQPLLVIVTRSSCADSDALKLALNSGSEVKEILAKGRFAVVHAEDSEANEWQVPYQGYSPQVTFWAPGDEQRPMPITGNDPHGKPHHITDEETLAWGMKNVLWGLDGGPRPVRDSSKKPKDRLSHTLSNGRTIDGGEL